MNISNDGLTLWFGTPDAYAPFEGEVVERQGVSLVVGAHPANPCNSVVVRFRVDRGLLQTVAGRELRVDYTRDLQYFAAAFPRFVTGQLVEYVPVLSCAGRQVPAYHSSERFRSFFRLK